MSVARCPHLVAIRAAGAAAAAATLAVVGAAGLCARAQAAAATTPAVASVAGTGAAGYSGDGGPAAAARLRSPSGVAVDPQGDVLVADTGNCRVREVAATTADRFGVRMEAHHIYTVAGDGTCGYSGDGGPAAAARLRSPSGVAVDPQGDVLVADTDNCRVREVNGAGISTLAGDGTCGYSGDGGPASEAELWDPTGVAADPEGDVVIADYGNRLVRAVVPAARSYLGVTIAAGDIGTVAGMGSYAAYLTDGQSATGLVAAIDFPYGVALDRAGNLYISDTYSRSVREVPASGGTYFGTLMSTGDLYTVAGDRSPNPSTFGKPDTPTVLTYPKGIAVDRRGDLIVADAGSNSLREIRAGDPRARR
jgi:secreted PhoX family phosphatase